MRVSKLSGVLAGVMVLAMGVTVAAQRSERGSTTRQSETQAQQQRQAQPRSGSQQARNEVCPADIQNLRVQTAQTENGGALVFTTSEANSRDLRQRLTRFIEVHDQMMQQQGSQGMQQGSQGMQQPPQQQRQAGATGSTGSQQRQAGATGSQEQRRFADMQALIHQGRAEMIEIPNGAVLLFSMESQDRVSDLQSELRQDAQALQQGRCPLSLQLESA